MGQVSIELNGKSYVVGCEDGQENHLSELGRRFDTQVRQVSQSVGQLGDTRLFLMAALMMADELAETQAQLARAKESVAGGRGVENRAAGALAAAASRIEALAARIGQNPA